MKIIRAKDYKDMSRKAANIISAQVIMKPNCVLGLATGGTPVGAYAQLVEWYNKGDIDFSEVTTVNLDEYRGLPKEHPESYWSFMHKNLFDHVNIRPEAIHLPDGTNPDAADACAKYNEIIHSVGGIDLQLLGKVLVVANGLAKAKAVKAVVSGPVTPECPGSILQMHPDCILVADEEALSLL